MLDFDTIPLNDKKSFHLLSMGLTKGVFQLEEHLGERYAQVVKPQTVEDIADIISIIRPGCKEAFHVDGETTMLDAYCKIRNKEMEEAYLHDDLKPILGKTHSVLIYQEQIIEICRHMAGMSLEEGDMVRKAMGKKKPEEMHKWQSVFVDGCKNQGYDEELGLKMWDWIEKAAGYLFNKSHAVAYAKIAYKTAYAKTNHPTAFYTAMLKYADKKVDTYEEMLELINDAKLFDIKVIPPVIEEANPDFHALNSKTIAFGIKYLKGVGESSMSAISRLRGVKSWKDFLVLADRFKVDKTSAEALIKSGVLDEFQEPRTFMLAEYELFRALTKNEQAIVLSLMSRQLHPSILIDIDKADFEQKRTVTKYAKLHRTGIFDVCGKYGPIASLPLPRNELDLADNDWDLEHSIYNILQNEIPTSKRREKLEAMMEEYRSKSYGVNQGLHQQWEKFYFGIPLTSNDKGLVIDSDTIPCIEVINMAPDAKVKIAGVIERVNYAKVKRGESKGKTMAFVDIGDNSYMLKGVLVFSNAFEKYGENIHKGQAVVINGRKMADSNTIMAYSVERM